MVQSNDVLRQALTILGRKLTFWFHFKSRRSGRNLLQWKIMHLNKVFNSRLTRRTENRKRKKSEKYNARRGWGREDDMQNAKWNKNLREHPTPLDQYTHNAAHPKMYQRPLSNANNEFFPETSSNDVSNPFS